MINTENAPSTIGRTNEHQTPGEQLVGQMRRIGEGAVTILGTTLALGVAGLVIAEHSLHTRGKLSHDEAKILRDKLQAEVDSGKTTFAKANETLTKAGEQVLLAENETIEGPESDS